MPALEPVARVLLNEKGLGKSGTARRERLDRRVAVPDIVAF